MYKYMLKKSGVGILVHVQDYKTLLNSKVIKKGRILYEMNSIDRQSVIGENTLTFDQQ